MNIVEAFHDRNLLGHGIRDFSTFTAQEVILRAAYGLGFKDEEQHAIYTKFTGRIEIPAKQFKIVLMINGRRSGKSYLMAENAVFLALFRNYKKYLALGEVATIMVIAADRDQARTIMRYIAGILEAPLLKQKLLKTKASKFEFQGQVVIEVATCSFRSVRGYTIAAVLADEAAFWSDENGANPASAVFAALKPAMMTIPNSMMIIGTTPYARRGPIWDFYDRFYGIENNHTLVWQAPTLDMNPSIDPAEVELEFQLDPANAEAEYNAKFRTDVEALLSREVVEAITVNGRFAIPYDPNKQFYGAIDASGGSSDSFTLGIAHAEDARGILDLVREVRPPFSPDQVCSDYAEIMRGYNISKCSADRYALGSVMESFSKYGITIEHSEMDRSAIYGNFLPMANARRIELLDHSRLRQQLLGLERKTSRLKEIIDHSRGQHDDVCNAACLALVSAAGTLSGSEMWSRFGESYQDFALEQFGHWKVENAGSFRGNYGGTG